MGSTLSSATSASRYLALATLVACATAPKPHTFNNAARVSASYDAVWAATINAFASNNWPIQTMEKDSGLIVSDWMKAPRDAFLDCGGSGLAIPQRQMIRFNVMVEGGPQATTVTVNVTGKEIRELDDDTFSVDCYSNGKAEQRIHTLVSQRARSRRGGAKAATADATRPAADATQGRDQGSVHQGFQRAYDDQRKRTTVRYVARLNGYTLLSVYYRYPGKSWPTDATPEVFAQFVFDRATWTFRDDHDVHLAVADRDQPLRAKWFGDVRENGVTEKVIARLDAAALDLLRAATPPVSVRVGQLELPLSPKVVSGIASLLRPFDHPPDQPPAANPSPPTETTPSAQ